MKVTVAVPTDLPCWETMKLPDWARAAGVTMRNAASGKKTRLRKCICMFLKDRRGNSENVPVD